MLSLLISTKCFDIFRWRCYVLYNITVPRLTSFSIAGPLLIPLPAVTVIWLYFII